MFDIGWGELLVIGIVALIAIGPKELPTVLRTLGQYMGKIKRMANEFQGQFQEAIREAEFADIKKQAEDIHSSVTDFASFDPMADAENPSERVAEGAGEPASEAAPVATAAPTAEPAAASDVSVPLPEAPAPVTEADFAAAEPVPPDPAPKQAGGSA
jgi:sec-independent protein translocase protein TatB